jgi:uncharacterized membrane protein
MTNFKAFTYDGKNTARKVLDVIEDSTATYYWEDDVALISVNKKGRVRVHSTWAQDSSNVPGGISFGAITGGLIGLLFGPGGALAGAAVGGSIGGLIGHHDNVKFDDPALDNFASSLVNDSSALVLLGDDDVVAEFAAAVADYDAAVFDAVLDDEAVTELQDEMGY